jgi:hypothetical protein
MTVVRLLACCAGIVCLALVPAARAQEPGGKGDFQVPTMGGMVVLADGKTLVVSVPSAGELLFYDTVEKKELKKVETDFQPTAMAVQGTTLFVVNKGTSSIHAIDTASGKRTKEIKIEKCGPLNQLACHPAKGLLYATTDALEVYSIDPASGKATKTKAVGQEIVVDPTGEKFVYTSHIGKGQKVQSLLKFQVNGADLKPVAANPNAGSGGPWFSVSRDGKRIAMSGPYRPSNVKGLTFNIGVFETRDMTTAAGSLDHSFFPSAIAFHPQLDLVATIEGGKAHVFSAKANTKKESLDVPKASTFPFKLIFAGEGTKLVSALGMLKTGRQDTAVAITVHDLTLTDEQKEQLKKGPEK